MIVPPLNLKGRILFKKDLRGPGDILPIWCHDSYSFPNLKGRILFIKNFGGTSDDILPIWCHDSSDVLGAYAAEAF